MGSKRTRGCEGSVEHGAVVVTNGQKVGVGVTL